MARLPVRPRLRASFWFEGDALQGELTLMDERRELVHRQRYAMNQGDLMVKIHQALLTIAAQSAANAGAVEPPPRLPSSGEPGAAPRGDATSSGAAAAPAAVPRAVRAPVPPSEARKRPEPSEVVPRAARAPAGAPGSPVAGQPPKPSDVVPRATKRRPEATSEGKRPSENVPRRK